MSAPDRTPPAFRLAVVPGVTPDRWGRTWSQRQPTVELELVHTEVADQGAALRDARADAGLVRLPVDRGSCDAIPLYTESTVVIVPRDHVLTAADELTLADLDGTPLLLPLDDVLAMPAPAAADPAGEAVAAADPAGGGGAAASGDRPASTAAAVELVAAGVGVLVVPQSLARLYHRRDLTYRVVTDAPTSTVALAWVRDRHTSLVEEMIGIVRGRTPNSTRGQAAAAQEVPGSVAAKPRPAPTGDRGRGAAPRRAGAKGSGAAGRTGTQGSGAAGRTGGNRHNPRRRHGK